MRELWGKVGFKPEAFELLDDEDKKGTLIIDKEIRLLDDPILHSVIWQLGSTVFFSNFMFNFF